MTALVIVAFVVAGLVIIASLEYATRAARELPVAPTLAPFVRRPLSTQVNRPSDLHQLEVLIAEAVNGQESARVRLVARVQALGIGVPAQATVPELLGAIERSGAS